MMRIGIDIDDTITDTKKVELEYMRKYAPELIGKSYKDCDHEVFWNFWSKYVTDILIKAEIKKGVKETFEYLKSKGYEIIIITARGQGLYYDPEKMTEEMLAKYQIPYDEIVYRSNPKGPDAKKYDVKLFIDDLDENLESVSDYGIECLKFVEKVNNNSKYKEFDNWFDLLSYLKVWGKEKIGD